MLSRDGEIQQVVVVTSIDALPGDPMRAQWQRRSERRSTYADLWKTQMAAPYPVGITEALPKITAA